MPNYNDYLRELGVFLHNLKPPPAHEEWRGLTEWYTGRGRQLFIDAFGHETALRIREVRNADALVAAALPKSINDLNAKATTEAFYRAHAWWFLQECDNMVRKVPAIPRSPHEEAHYESVRRFARKVFGDSLVLFEDWGRCHAKVPGVFGAFRNSVEHVMALAQGARQTIYGHGSFNLSFIDNHADLAISTLRQMLEIRLRRGFGIGGKVDKIGGGFHPIHLSDLLEAMSAHRQSIVLPFRFESLGRINSWANLYLHSGIKLYSWVPPRVLLYLWEFTVGGYSSKDGIKTTQATFDAIQNLIRAGHDPTKFDMVFDKAADCDVTVIP